MATKKYRRLKTVSDDQYLVFRAPQSGKLTKWRSDRRFIVEVRSRKTKKIVGYLNTIKGKGKKREILPRKFTKSQLSLSSRKKVKAPAITDETSFKVRFNERLIDQFKSNGRRSIRKILSEIKMNDEVLVGMHITTSKKGEKFITPLKMYSKRDADFDFMAQELAIIMINTIRSEAIRTSLKQHVDSDRIKERKMRRGATVKIQFGGFGF